MQREETIAKLLLEVKAVQVRVNPPFVWNTGLHAPIYCDNRLLASYPKERAVVVDGLKELIADNNLEFDVIAGTATAGIPWAAFLAFVLDKPMVYVRSQPKAYGAAKQVEGYMKKGARVLVVEDLISTGRSSLATVSACQREYDASVAAVLAIFTYEMEKAAKAFAEANIRLFTLSNFSMLIATAAQKNYLSAEEKQSALLWSSDPDVWDRAHKT